MTGKLIPSIILQTFSEHLIHARHNPGHEQNDAQEVSSDLFLSGVCDLVGKGKSKKKRRDQPQQHVNS